ILSRSSLAQLFCVTSPHCFIPITSLSPSLPASPFESTYLSPLSSSEEWGHREMAALSLPLSLSLSLCLSLPLSFYPDCSSLPLSVTPSLFSILHTAQPQSHLFHLTMAPRPPAPHHTHTPPPPLALSLSLSLLIYTVYIYIYIYILQRTDGLGLYFA